ncbi:MAG: hypothetical protein ABSD59_17290 [Terracidiphilus sp.]|jgi:hypothetical protein
MSTCIRCGVEGEISVRYVGISASTTYVGYEGKLKRTYKNTDEIAIWEVPICAKCVPGAVIRFYQAKIKYAQEGVMGCVIVSFFALVGLWVWIGLNPPVESVSTWKVVAILVLYVLMGAVGMISGAFTALLDSIRLHWPKIFPCDSNEETSGAFREEAKRILAERIEMTERTSDLAHQSNVTSDGRQLPKFKQMKDLSGDDYVRAAETGGRPTERNREVLSPVGLSREDLLAKLPKNWVDVAI